MNLKTKLVIGAALVLAAGGLASQAVAADQADHRPTATIHATWDFHPTTLAQARDRAENIVLAEVVSVRAGDDIVAPAEGEPDGVSRVPTQRVTIRVVNAYKGTAKQGEELTLFQTGGVVSTAKAGDSHPRLMLGGDPFYQKGERYLLMLVPGLPGTVRIISPEGRYRIDRSGGLTPMVDGPVANEIHGKKLANLHF